MVTHSQQMGAKGAELNEVQGRGTQPAAKKGFLSGRSGLWVITLFALALSVAFPFGLGVALFIWGIALIGAFVGAGFALVTLLQEVFGKTPAFGYTPMTAYLAGKKMKKKKREEPSSEDGKDVR